MKAKKRKQQEVVMGVRRDAFFTKIEEYKKLTLEELRELYNHPDKKKRPGGIYREALVEVVRQKQLEAANAAVQEATVEPTTEPNVTETTTEETTT